MSLTSYIQTQLPLIEKTLQALLAPLEKNCDPLLFEATKYTVLGNGKRIRPLLMLVALDSLGADTYKGLRPACAIELLHTYSLIHDDLPCMDDDDLRRGKPTLHKVYGEGQAVLVGDLLLTMAFEVLSSSPGVSAQEAIELVRILSSYAGGRGMILGQSLDLLAENQQIDQEALYYIHKRKTGDLFSAALEFAAILSQKNSLCSPLAEIGQAIGLSFQIIDDTLDVEGKEALLGKPVNSDTKNNKATSVSLMGITPSKTRAEQLLQNALSLCQKIGLENTLLAEFLPNLVYRKF